MPRVNLKPSTMLFLIFNCFSIASGVVPKNSPIVFILNNSFQYFLDKLSLPTAGLVAMYMVSGISMFAYNALEIGSNLRSGMKVGLFFQIQCNARLNFMDTKHHLQGYNRDISSIA